MTILCGTIRSIKGVESTPLFFSKQFFQSSVLRKPTRLPNMFTHFTTLLSIAALVAVASAAPGDVCIQNKYCCNQNFDGSIQFGGVLGSALAGTGPHAGLACDPIVVSGVDNVGCNGQTVCCTKQNINGVDTIVCTPVDAGM
ncbi:hypothetical protein V8E55_012013 [Tylopilus felleus]